ncbi:MAG: PhoPQ-activated pathogenicity-related family protein [Planctomycetes bacterium]|nr:PhoPQ-activated pathogenicity-related family protein [Planctomycetota bacterium]
MKHRSRLLPPVCVLLLLAGARTARALDLAEYVKAPDASYAWKIESNDTAEGVGTTLTIHMTSQTWHGIDWTHWLTVVVPEKVTHPEYALLLVSGGRNRDEPPKLSGEAMILAQLAQKTGTVVAVVQQVPNQPLFNNLREDGLIAFTFMNYFNTKDETWPCLLPMTKSAVRAMDTVQAVVKEKFQQEVQKFVVTGASKRGWTTWLTGAVDPRVCAIAPMVIDVLNFHKQMPHQIESFGRYSEQIGDYTELGLQALMSTPAGDRLLQLVDPYSYLDQLTMPKLIVLGTNDPYWPVDAAKLYFPDLKGDKYIHYVPNAGHGLGAGAVEAISAFYQSVVAGEERPKLSWERVEEGGRAGLRLTLSGGGMTCIEVWKATSPTRDFRKAEWSPDMTEEGLHPIGDLKLKILFLPTAREDFAAYFGRVTYKSSLGMEYSLCTNVEVLAPPAKPKEPVPAATEGSEPGEPAPASDEAGKSGGGE